MTNKCRREFEEWAKPSSLRRRQQRGDTSQYINPTTNLMWATWQAAYNKRTKDAEELVKCLRELRSHDNRWSSADAVDAFIDEALANWESNEQ